MMLVTSPGTVHYQCRSERPIAAYQAGVENPVSHHFAHNDLLLADDATHLAIVSCWVAQCYDTTPVRTQWRKQHAADQ